MLPSTEPSFNYWCNIKKKYYHTYYYFTFYPPNKHTHTKLWQQKQLSPTLCIWIMWNWRETETQARDWVTMINSWWILSDMECTYFDLLSTLWWSRFNISILTEEPRSMHSPKKPLQEEWTLSLLYRWTASSGITKCHWPRVNDSTEFVVRKLFSLEPLTALFRIQSKMTTDPTTI